MNKNKKLEIMNFIKNNEKLLNNNNWPKVLLKNIIIDENEALLFFNWLIDNDYCEGNFFYLQLTEKGNKYILDLYGDIERNKPYNGY